MLLNCRAMSMVDLSFRSKILRPKYLASSGAKLLAFKMPVTFSPVTALGGSAGGAAQWFAIQASSPTLCARQALFGNCATARFHSTVWSCRGIFHDSQAYLHPHEEISETLGVQRLEPSRFHSSIILGTHRLRCPGTL